MRPELISALRESFPLFFRRVFKELNPDKSFEKCAYLDLLCHDLVRLQHGEIQHLNVNLPPGHMKTTLCSKAFAAWILGHDPSAQLLIITGAEFLTGEIAFDIRQIIQSRWFSKVFDTRLRPNRTGLFAFETTRGGGCFSTTVRGNFTGLRADYIIMDDIVDISDANNLEYLRWVNNIFDTKIITRLNNMRTGRILNICQRLHPEDLSGHLLKQGEWHSVILPFIAPRSRTYRFGGEVWHRKRGELLRPNSLTEKRIKTLRRNSSSPDFETLYQQNPAGELLRPIRRHHFGTFDSIDHEKHAVILSVDGGQQSDGSSFSVIQAWCRIGDQHCLIDQWRGKVDFHELLSMVRKFRLKYRPRAILIERAALGIPLISEGTRRRWRELVPIELNGQSKNARFMPHVRKIRRRLVALPAGAVWRRDFETEVIGFPNTSCSDQVDAMTQYLTWIEGKPPYSAPAARGVIAAAQNSAWRGRF